jgi:DUF1680 family protein
MIAILFSCAEESRDDYPVQPVPFTAVHLDDDFWAPRIEINRRQSIPFAMAKNEETGRVDNFAKAAGLMEGKYEGRRFNDTDVYKVIEGAAYSLQLAPDPELETKLDRIIDLIAGAQEDDGYIYPARTVDPSHPAPGAGPERWSRLRGSHELYNAGHLYEAAVAYYQATGKTKLLDVALKNADFLLREFGPEARQDFPGHQEVEIGLAKLYRLTGKRGYIDLARFFLDQRGRERDQGFYGEDTNFALYNRREYMQDHVPVLEQNEAVGHAVRASYMYSGMADVAALTGSPDYIEAIDRIWQNVVSKKLYLTGGIGARHTTEAFGDDYELPNRTAYTETCAGIGNVFWNHRQFLLHGDADYIDVLERTLYNTVVSGVSLSGDRFFYQNPLESGGDVSRSPWFEVACCPGNMTRFLPSIPGYVYAQKDDVVFINLFVSSHADLEMDGERIELRQETDYPWKGKVKIQVEPAHSANFAVNIRIPGWARNRPVPSDLYGYIGTDEAEVTIAVNGEPVDVVLEKGFVPIRRDWKKGDVIELDLPMPIRRVTAHDSVQDNRGKVALERGPIVYCAEWVDNGGRVLDLILPDGAELDQKLETDLLGGVVVVRGKAVRVENGEIASHEIVAIPYHLWANRGEGEMTVWLPRNVEAAQGES